MIKIGESKDSTIITGKVGSGCFVDSDKDFAIENFKLTGNFHVGGTTSIYDFYRNYRKLPKLVINNCVFENKCLRDSILR